MVVLGQEIVLHSVVLTGAVSLRADALPGFATGALRRTPRVFDTLSAIGTGPSRVADTLVGESFLVAAETVVHVTTLPADRTVAK